jgi:hypothetical protein
LVLNIREQDVTKTKNNNRRVFPKQSGREPGNTSEKEKNKIFEFVLYLPKTSGYAGSADNSTSAQ